MSSHYLVIVLHSLYQLVKLLTCWGTTCRINKDKWEKSALGLTPNEVARMQYGKDGHMSSSEAWEKNTI